MAKKNNNKNTYKIYKNENSDEYERVDFNKLFRLVKEDKVGYSDKRHIWFYFVILLLVLVFVFM